MVALQAKQSEEQAKKMEEQTEQLAGEVASRREALENLVTQIRWLQSESMMIVPFLKVSSKHVS